MIGVTFILLALLLVADYRVLTQGKHEKSTS